MGSLLLQNYNECPLYPQLLLVKTERISTILLDARSFFGFVILRAGVNAQFQLSKGNRALIFLIGFF